MFLKLKSLKNHQGFIKYFKNTSWLFFEKILRMVIGLFVGIWVARYLGPEQFGLLSYSQSFVGLFIAISMLGLDGIIIRELIKDENRRDELLGTAFWLKFFGAFLVLVILAIAIHFTSNDTYTNILVFIIASATIFQSFNVVDLYFQSKVLSKFVVYANIISLFISSVIKVLLILNEASLISFVWVILFDSFILACGFIYFYIKNNLSLFKWRFDKTVAIDLLKDSWPLLLSALFATAYMKIDQIMIHNMLDSYSVGIYSVAVRMTELFYFIPLILKNSLQPIILKLKDKEVIREKLSYIFILIIWTSLFCVFVFILGGEWFILKFFGEQYIDSVPISMILIWTNVFVAIAFSFSIWLLSENLQKKTIYMGLFGLISNIVGNIILIPIYGVYGAAVATLIGHFFTYIIYDIFDKDFRKIFILKVIGLFPVVLLIKRKKKNEL